MFSGLPYIYLFFDAQKYRYVQCTGDIKDRKFFQRLSFSCIVFDEAHMLKNMSSQRYQRLMKLQVITSVSAMWLGKGFFQAWPAMCRGQMFKVKGYLVTGSCG